MTEHSDTRPQENLRGLINDAAEEFVPGTAPYDAIVGGGRRRVRARAVGGSALSVVAIGAAVAVGVSSFGGTRHAAAQTVGAAAGGTAATPVAATASPEATTTATKPAAAQSAPPAVNNDHYGRTVIAQGDFHGQHWTLTRETYKKDGVNVLTGPEGKVTIGSEAYDDVYFTAANGKRDRAGGGSTAPGHLSELLNHFDRPDVDPAAGVTVANLGLGTMDDSSQKEKPSPYGIAIISGIVDSKVARVQVVLDSGTTQDATLVAAPSGEDGQYYYLPVESSTWHTVGHIVLYDAQGNVLTSRFSQFY